MQARDAYACFFVRFVYSSLVCKRAKREIAAPRLTVVGLLRRKRSVSGGRAAHVQSRTLRVPAGAQVHQTVRGLQN